MLIVNMRSLDDSTCRTTVAVADGETVRLLDNTGVKPEVLGRDHGGPARARPLRLEYAPSHQFCQLR